jgi:hypothetical protein
MQSADAAKALFSVSCALIFFISAVSKSKRAAS